METDTPCTPADRQRIIQAAVFRVGFLRWIAAKLLTTDDKLIRKEAAAALAKF